QQAPQQSQLQPQLQAQHNSQQPNTQGPGLSINAATAVAHQRIQHPQGVNSPQSAVQPQSATASGPPRALSHQAAINEAARSYSNGLPASTMAHAHPSQGAREPTHSQTAP